MATRSLSLVHRMRRPRPEPSGPAPLLLLLHGYGSSEDDLFALAPYLDARFCVVSVRAPLPLSWGGWAWFPLIFTSEGPSADLAEARQSQEITETFIGEAVAAYGLDPARVYLLGFSQGAITALGLALTRPERVAGVVAMSGMLPPLPDAARAAPSALAGLPILAVHGTADSVLPVARGRALRDALSSLPVALTYQEYPMAHTVTEESLTDVAAWLTERLGGA